MTEPKRIGKKEVAHSLGGAFISQKGQINYRKLENYLCRVLAITPKEYRENTFFTEIQINILIEKGILK